MEYEGLGKYASANGISSSTPTLQSCIVSAPRSRRSRPSPRKVTHYYWLEGSKHLEADVEQEMLKKHVPI
jgi:hypothetical protein